MLYRVQFGPFSKAKVEAAVLIAERWILAALRDHVFFGLKQLNAAISEKLREFNLRRLQRLGVSRRELYETLDAPALLPLPPRRYEFALWGKGRMGIDYHIEVERHFYSAPWTLARQEVEWRLCVGSVEILHRGVRVAAHPRSFRRGGFTTDPAHMPEAHRKQLEWTPERIVRWAETMGQGCREAVCRILASKPHPQQGFRACLGVLRLAGKHDPALMEAACVEAIRKDACSFQGIKSILARMLSEPEERERHPLPPCENVRGSAYYREVLVD